MSPWAWEVGTWRPRICIYGAAIGTCSRALVFSVGVGECLQITGSNGAGKSTLLRTLSGLMYAEEGHVLWGGHNIREDLQGYHGDLAYIGHEPPLKVDFTARRTSTTGSASGGLYLVRRSMLRSSAWGRARGVIVRFGRCRRDRRGGWRSRG